MTARHGRTVHDEAGGRRQGPRLVRTAPVSSSRPLIPSRVRSRIGPPGLRSLHATLIRIMLFDDAGNRARLATLRARGVDAWGPERVYVSEDVDLEAIEPGAVIRQATLTGRTLRIATGAVIGTTGHAEVDSCQIGRNTALGAGLYQGATFLEGVKIRGFAEIRPGTLLEEQVDLAHCVALKNTTFTCCCVAGSLINFCDLFLSGGTSRQDHTEIGSGAVHYNFDPRGDKWGSLLGGIRGVALRSDPVFIGGTCGLVGPLEIGFGGVTAAGSVIRKDVRENELVADSGKRLRRPRFDRHSYGPLKRQFFVTVRLISTLRALDVWYSEVRAPCARGDELPLYEAARERIDTQIQERIQRLGKVVAKLARTASSTGQGPGPQRQLKQHVYLIERWEPLRESLETPIDHGPPPAAFLDRFAAARETGHGHVGAVKAAESGAGQAERWVEGMVERFASSALLTLNPIRF